MTGIKQPSFQIRSAGALGVARQRREWRRKCCAASGKACVLQVVTRKEFNDLGEKFEDKEHELFGKQGFEGIVGQVEELERALGIFDLNQFTPG